MLVVIIFFGFLFSDLVPFTNINDTSTSYVQCGDQKFEIVNESSKFAESSGIKTELYFSTITFLTIGYGDISPQNPLTALLAGIEGFFGLFLMSYFTVAIVRKTLR